MMDKYYGITSRTMAQDGEFIEFIRIGLLENGKWIVNPLIIHRDIVVKLIKNEKLPKVYTLVLGKEKYRFGEIVDIYPRVTSKKKRVNEFIRSKANDDDKDNLENLPDCPRGLTPVSEEQIPVDFFSTV